MALEGRLIPPLDSPSSSLPPSSSSLLPGSSPRSADSAKAKTPFVGHPLVFHWHVFNSKHRCLPVWKRACRRGKKGASAIPLQATEQDPHAMGRRGGPGEGSGDGRAFRQRGSHEAPKNYLSPFHPFRVQWRRKLNPGRERSQPTIHNTSSKGWNSRKG